MDNQERKLTPAAEAALDGRDVVDKARAWDATATKSAEIARLRATLQAIADYGEEENEWDAVDRYDAVREMAKSALAA